MSRHQDRVGVRLGNTGRDGADAGLRDQLDAYLSVRIYLLQVVDQLSQILD